MDWEPGRSLLDHAGLVLDLQDLLGTAVEVGTERSLHWYVREQHPRRGCAAVKDGRLYLHHMLERCERVAGYIAGGRAAFFASEQQQDAVIRNLEVIGECANSIALATRYGSIAVANADTG